LFKQTDFNLQHERPYRLVIERGINRLITKALNKYCSSGGLQSFVGGNDQKSLDLLQSVCLFV